MIDFNIYEMAKDAEEVFHAALVKEYGEHRAGDMRYQPEHWPPHVRACADAFHRAAACWRDEMAAVRREHRAGDGGLDVTCLYRIDD